MGVLEMDGLRPGDRVNWAYTPNGGYGYTMSVAAIVVGKAGSRARIRVARKVDGVWKLEEKSVSPEKLTPRTSVCPELGEGPSGSVPGYGKAASVPDA